MEQNINLLTTEAAARYLGLKPSTLCAWRVKGDGPRYIKIGRAVRYSLSSLNNFIAQNVCANTAQSVLRRKERMQ